MIMGSVLMGGVELPQGAAPEPVAIPWFPDRLHAFVWRNWQLAPIERVGEVVGAKPEDVLRMGQAMGLPAPPRISQDQRRRSFITIIRRNWHLLPYEQLLTLLDWTPEQLAFTLREDDFLYAKLGGLKPHCEPLRYALPDEAARRREQEIARVIREEFPEGFGELEEPLFQFVADLSKASRARREAVWSDNAFSPRYCYSYFALYGDPLLDEGADPFPDGYLARLADSGVTGVWLQGVLYKLSPFPWDAGLSAGYEQRRENLRKLVARARKHGMGIYLYLNEPRAMPLPFFETHADLKGVVEGDHATLCTSQPSVRDYLRDAVQGVCEAAPDLAGFFTISASENLTHCWSHGGGANCRRCGQRTPAEVIAELHESLLAGIHDTEAKTRLIAWDWGWGDDWAPVAVERLPRDVSFMSVSEWSTPISRGGIDSVVGEYSISVVGPGPRATRHWELARARGLKTLAKIQANCTWELSAVPYLPVLENVAQHIANLREARVDGLMLSWTLGGYPSPNLEAVTEMGRSPGVSVSGALETVAIRRFGPQAGPAVVEAWRQFSAAFCEFPFHGGLVYTAPMQYGPSNPLWSDATGYRATMVGFPYDDLEAWRQVYTAEVFIGQFEKVANGFEQALAALRKHTERLTLPKAERTALAQELIVAEAAAIHFRSTENQARFVLARNKMKEAQGADTRSCLDEMERCVVSELGLAKRLYEIQIRDSRIGFEASNQYYYVPYDLGEKVINCRYLLDKWRPTQKAKPEIGTR
ncbi:MAG: hypothetical protein HY706_02815 [Candidatus Hydrogenedentes bacterium]|nr:hypothetical protein [Candidatus Hydrogenedentota bacterium]